MAKGKNKRVSITINEKELLALEDFLICWNLCKQHQSKSLEMEEKDFALALVTCPKCIKINKRLHKEAWQVCSKLWAAYIKP